MDRWLREFFASEIAGGITMLALAALAMLLANSPLAALYRQFTETPLLGLSLHAATNDILMPVFFLFVGLELKYEMQRGALADSRARVLPLIAALGGIALPALLYLANTSGTPQLAHGWAIPTATDIAFAICIVNLAGNAVPAPAKIFLLAIAIYDDLAAILIIALFYSQSIGWLALGGALAVSALMAWLSHRERGAVWQFIALGIALGLLLHIAGVHTTVAGMVTGLCIPMQARRLGDASPLEKLVHQLHPVVSFIILPLFAFCSAGISFVGIGASTMVGALPLGIALGLFAGKQLGIFAATFATVKLGIAPLPKGTDWRVIYAIALIAGIGFTMSLFIGQLALDAPLHNALKLGVMGGSLLSAIGGLLACRLIKR